MKIRASIRSILLGITLMAFSTFAEDKVLFESLKIGDTTVKNVRVSKATPTHVTLFFDGGGATLKRQDLPPELQTLYPYDPQEVADYEKQQAAQQEQRTAEARARQQQANRELKVSLQQQQLATQNRITDLEKQLNQLEKELSPMKAKARKKPRSTARAEFDTALDKKQDFIHRINELKNQLAAINKQLDHLP